MTRGRASFVVLGCAKNQVEAETMSSRLAALGWDITSDIPNASVLIVHTCGFLEAARQEALRTVADLRKAAPRAFLVMTGCFAQYVGEKRPSGVDALLGTGEFFKLPELINGVKSGKWEVRSQRSAPLKTSHLPLHTSHASVSPGGYHDPAQPRPLRRHQLSAYLRVSEGCNHRCAFCVIPQLRGNLKSRAPEDIRQEARGLVDRGVREIVLISQDTTDYGRDLSPRVGITDLLKGFLAWDDLRWLRLLYGYPSEVDDGLVRLLAEEEKLCGYLDMPLQHMADPILKSMKRDWGEKPTRDLLDRLRSRVPHLALRTTFIVGFPGETEQHFRRVLETVEAGYFEHVGVFPYSPEPRSPSDRFSDQVPAVVAQERFHRLLEAQSRVMEKKARARLGKEIPVLVEQDVAGRWTARAGHQAPEVDGQVLLSAYPGQAGFYQARITGFQGIDLKAELVPGKNSKTKMERVKSHATVC